MPSLKLSFPLTARGEFAERVLVVLMALLFLAACQKSVIRQTVSAEDEPVKPVSPFMTETNNKLSKAIFYNALEKALERRGSALANLFDSEDAISRRIVEEYGALFLASEKVLPPPVCMFTSAEEVLQFQKQANVASATIAGATIELQSPAIEALLAARAEANQKGLDITPRDGAEAARRSYDDTLRLWNSRFLPALEHWKKLGKLSREEIENLKRLPVREQVGAVLELEKRGIFFSTYFDKSILYSVAAPGTSQHLSMLAFDANEYADKKVRKILAKHGWFRTVKSDAPHFTFLGANEADLPALGLKKIKTGDGEYWVPNVL